MDEWKKIANHMGRMVIAAVKPKRDITGPKSFTDEYPWLKESAPREHVSKEVREHWAKMAKIARW